jgi:hypothetical protein
MWRFMKAVLLGALASAALPTVFTIWIASMLLPEIKRGDHVAFWQAAYVVVLPLMVALPVVLISAVVVGLPTAAFLKWRRRESRAADLATGAIAGTIIPVATLALQPAQDGHWIGLLGAVGGGVTAHVWWSSARPSDIGHASLRRTGHPSGKAGPIPW